MAQSAKIAGLSGEATLQNVVTGAGPRHRAVGVADPVAASGGGGLRLVVSRGPGKGVEIVLARPVTVIGRHRDCDIAVGPGDHGWSRQPDRRFFQVSVRSSSRLMSAMSGYVARYDI